MKTLLSIGVLVAVIAWAAGQDEDKIECWRGKPTEQDTMATVCVLNPGTTLKEGAGDAGSVCEKAECKNYDLLHPEYKVACWKKILSFGMKVVQTALGCGTVETEADFKCFGESTVLDEKPGGTETNCFCKTALCNDDPTLKPKPETSETPKPETTPKPEKGTEKGPETGTQNGAVGTSYTHLIIAFIVGAMFLH